MSTHTIACIGDSQTDYNNGLGVRPDQTWPAVLAQILNLQGCNVRCRNFGTSGDTSQNNLNRVDVMSLYDAPTMGIVYVGVNDPGGSITQAQTQANLQAIIKSLKFGAVGASYDLGVTAATPSALPATGKLGQRYVVLSDNDTTGGAAAWHSSMAPTITGTLGGSPQSVWEFRYAMAGAPGWGRIATAATTPTNCKQIIVVSANYLNWTGTGGDTPSTDYATYATVRTAQAAAVTAEDVLISGDHSVIFCDLHLFQKTRIIGGTIYGQTFAAQTDPNFSSDTSIVPTTAYNQAISWHVSSNNQHHNAYGHALVAQVIQAAITNQTTTWITNLT